MERTRWPGIYRRNEAWVAVVGYASRGKRRQKWLTAASLRDAQRARRDFLDSLSKGVRPEDATMTVAELSGLWLADLEDIGRRPATLSRYRKVLRIHILPAFGATRLKDLDRDELRSFERSHVGEFDVFSAMLGWAVKDRGTWLPTLALRSAGLSVRRTSPRTWTLPRLTGCTRLSAGTGSRVRCCLAWLAG